MPTGPGSVPVDDHEYDEGWAAFDRGDWAPGEVAAQSASFLAGFRAAAEDHGDPRGNTEAATTYQAPPPMEQDDEYAAVFTGSLMQALTGTAQNGQPVEIDDVLADVHTVETYREAMISAGPGLLLTMGDGRQIQLTVQAYRPVT